MASTVGYSQQASTDYDKHSVDEYIGTISREYDTLKNQYASLLERYSQLARLYGTGEVPAGRQMPDASAQVARIIADARGEAERIVRNAYKELYYLNYEKKKIAAELTEMAKRLTQSISM